jgi:hypothetical protein
LNSFDEDVSGGDENAFLRGPELPLDVDRGEARGGEENTSGDECAGLWKVQDEGDKAGIVAVATANISAA